MRRGATDLGAGGSTVHFQLLAVLVMRHVSGGGPTGWSDDELAVRFHQPVEDLKRAQAVIDEVAADIERPGSPGQH